MPDAAIAERADEAAEVPVPQRQSSSPCMAKLDRLSWATCDWFAIQDHRFGVRSTSPGFGEWVRYALGGYRVDGPRDADGDPLYALIVEDDASPSGRAAKRLHIFYYGTFGIIRTLDVMAVARSFITEIESLTFPIRDDAVYLEASLIRGQGRTVLIPALMVPDVSSAGRRIRGSIDVALPAHMSIALDPASGHAVPVSRTLDVPADVLEVVGDFVPVGSPEDARAVVDRELAIDRVVMIANGGEPGLSPVSRGAVLYELARSIRNLAMVGGDGVTTIARLLAGADVVKARWGTSAQLVGMIEAAVDGGRYVPERREGTPEER
jgi:hypothetical protein